MRLLVTRPAEDATPLAVQLGARGHDVVTEPLMRVRFRPDALPSLSGIAALLFTSANGARAFAEASAVRDLPAYAVGERTTAALREAGFTRILTAEGDAAALGRLVVAQRKPEDGPLLHIASKEVAGDLAGSLGNAGFAVSRAVLYETVAAEDLSSAVKAALQAAQIDGVLLFSPRTARIFADCLDRAGLADAGRHLTAWCLSAPVAEALAETRITDRRVAPRPTQEALLALIGDAVLSSAGSGAPAASKKEDAVSVTPPPATGTADDAAPLTDESQPHRDRSMLLIGGAVVLLALIGGATSPFWAPNLPWAPKPPNHQEAPQVAMAPAPAPPPAAPAGAIQLGPTAPIAIPDDALHQEIDRLTQRVGALEARPAPDQSLVTGVAADEQKLASSLAALTDRVATLETQLKQLDQSAGADKAMILALGDLHAALAGSGPYDGQVAVLASLAGNDQALQAPIAVLQRHAKTGLPSRTVLADRLSDLAPELTVAPALVGDNAPWWRRYLVNPVLRLVRISRVPEHGDIADMPPGPDRTVAEAEAALGQGDLAGAVDRIRSLPDNVKATAAPWLADATARLDAEGAAAALSSAATRRLGAGAAP